MKNLICTLSILHFGIYISLAQPGSLDNSFGTGGYTATQIFNTSAAAKAIARQADGKYLTAGVLNYAYHTSDDDIVLVRYNANGSTDNTFGTNGIVRTNFAQGTDDIANAVAIQSDGKIVIAGQSVTNFALARYNTDGTLDNTFGTGGMITTIFGSSSSAANGIVVLPGNKIVAVGNAGSDFALARYNTDGTLDNTFGTGGKVTTDFTSTGDVALSVALMNDGRLVVSGYTVNFNGEEFALARYNSNGTLDNSFGNGGKLNTVIVTPTATEAMAASVLLQPDGKIVACGTSWPDGSTWEHFALVRYSSNGVPDNSFGNGGIVITAFGTTGNASARAAVLQSDGKIIAGGVGPASGIALARYNTDGSLDNSFGTAGLVQNTLGSDAEGAAMLLQSDGKIVVAGGRDDFNAHAWFFMVARFNGGSPLGIANETNDNDQFNIFPNPSSGIFTITSGNDNEGTICIYDELGNCVQQFQNGKLSQRVIDLSDKPKGIYFVELISGNEKALRKIALQ